MKFWLSITSADWARVIGNTLKLITWILNNNFHKIETPSFYYFQWKRDNRVLNEFHEFCLQNFKCFNFIVKVEAFYWIYINIVFIQKCYKYIPLIFPLNTKKWKFISYFKGSFEFSKRPRVSVKLSRSEGKFSLTIFFLLLRHRTITHCTVLGWVLILD